MLNPPDLTDTAPWKARFRVPLIGYAAIAEANPARGLAFTNLSGVYQLHAWDVPTGRLTQVTRQPAGVGFGGISPDGRWVYYHQDEQGNEIGHYVRVPFDAPQTPPQVITPQLTPYASFFFSESRHGRVIGFTVAGAEGFRYYTLHRGDDDRLSEPQVLTTSARFGHGPYLSADGRYGVVATTERSQFTDYSLMAFDLRQSGDQARVLVLEEEEGGIVPVGFSPVAGDPRLLANTDATGFERPVIWSVDTGDRTDIPLVGLDGDFRAWGWSPDATRILLCQVAQAHHQLYIYDLERATLHRLNHPSGTFNTAYFYDDETLFAVFQNSVTPSAVLKLDARTGEQTGIALNVAESVPPSQRWRSVTFPSSGGQTIQAWLVVPEGAGPFPAIVHAHGGPTYALTDVYSPDAQAWVDHGFAWLSVNYRGSTTFGRQFEHSILGRLGQLEVDDLAAARDYLVREGIAQPDKIIVTGWSYGGYLTLQALGVRPELWAGGMAGIAIADWTLMYEDQAETLRGYQRSLFGGTPDELPEQHAASSPITYAEKVRAPVIVIQGANDTRCPARQMRVYEEKLRSLGKEIEVVWFDAGHGSRANEDAVEHQAILLAWAHRVLS